MFIDIRKLSEKAKERFENKDFVNYKEFMNEFEDILTELERKEEELSELRNDIEYNYKPINVDLEFYGMSQNDFI